MVLTQVFTLNLLLMSVTIDIALVQGAVASREPIERISITSVIVY